MGSCARLAAGDRHAARGWLRLPRDGRLRRAGLRCRDRRGAAARRLGRARPRRPGARAHDRDATRADGREMAREPRGDRVRHPYPGLLRRAGHGGRHSGVARELPARAPWRDQPARARDPSVAGAVRSRVSPEPRMSPVSATDPSILRDLLVSRASSDPDALAFDDGRRRVTYAELAESAAAKAARLASLGVRPGDRVALVMSAGVAWAEAFWGAQLLGAASAAFNPRLPASTLERQAARVRPRLVLTDDSLDSAPMATMPPEPPIGSDDLAFLQPTSGTSGEPRAAMLLHRNVIAYLRADSHEWAHRGDVFVAWVPPWHDMGLVRFIIGGVAHGVECHIVQPAISTIPLF